MQLRFATAELDRLETDQTFTAGFPREVVRSFRAKVNYIRAALDERDLRKYPGWRMEKLKGTRSHQYSLRLNQQWRLIFELETAIDGKVVVVISIEDYH